MKTATTLAFNTAAQLLAKVVTTLVTLFATYLISKAFGTVGVGEFIAATSYVALFYLLSDFGINAIFTKKVHSEKAEEDKSRLFYFFENLVSVRLILGIGISFLAVAILAFLNYPVNVKVAIVFASLLIFNQALFATAAGVFQLKLRYEFSAVAEIVGSLLTLVLLLFFLQAGLGIVYIILAYVLGTGLRSLLALVFARRLVGGLGVGSDTSLWKIYLFSSIPLGMMAIFSQIMANIDKVILSLSPLSADLGYNNLQAVGIYGLAYKFFDVSLVLPTYLMNAAFPIFVKTAGVEPARLKEIVKKLGFTMVGIALVIAVVGFLLAPLVLGFFLEGSDLSGSVQSLRILVLGMPLFYLSALLVWLVVALNEQRYLIAIYFVAALTNLTLNLYLIPRFGYLASAWLTLLSEVIIVLGAALLLWQKWGKEKVG
jgi:O-antigen/teichoic acid export membrane protein